MKARKVGQKLLTYNESWSSQERSVNIREEDSCANPTIMLNVLRYRRGEERDPLALDAGPYHPLSAELGGPG